LADAGPPPHMASSSEGAAPKGLRVPPAIPPGGCRITQPLVALSTSQYRCEEQGGAPRPTPAVPLLTQKRNQKTATRSLWSNPSCGPNPTYGRLWASALRERFALSSRLGSLRSPFLDCPFSWRRSQSRSLRRYRSAYSLLVQPTAPFTRPEKRQGDLTSFATVACGEPLGCASFSLPPEPRVVGAGRQGKASSFPQAVPRYTPTKKPTPYPSSRPHRLPIPTKAPSSEGAVGEAD